jgi:beta-lactamase regulating signal transducer with metallopeptidase domain
MKPSLLSRLLPLTLADGALPSLIDAAAKSCFLLLFAAIVCLVLHRASAATRHFVWLSALGAALVLPLLSLGLPQWCVLPPWMDITRETENAPLAVTTAADHSPPVSLTETPSPYGDVSPAPSTAPALPSPDGRTGAMPARPFRTTPAVWLAVWGAGVILLLIRLVRSMWVLWRISVAAHVVTDGPFVMALNEVANELGRCAPALHLGPVGAMPMVWGVGRGRLLLPADALSWSTPSLRAVLLHELAHLRRRDPLAMVIVQVARAVYWFNPLAWFAVRQLGIEQERACDDVVLRAGIKPSDYAEHVLGVVTGHQPAPLACSTALAMASQSRLEGRLRGILDVARNRRTLSRRLVALTLLTVGFVTFSLAMIRAADETKPKREEEPTINTVEPKHEASKAFLKAIRFRQNKDGTFPASALASLRAQIEAQLKTKPSWKDGAAARKWLDGTAKDRNWKESELIPLLDEAAAWSVPVVSWAELVEQFAAMDTIKPGKAASPEQLKKLTFGPAAENGLRVAWVLEPAKESYAVGEVLKCHVVFHNAGKAPVQFVTELWHQHDHWTVRDADGKEIKTRGVWYTGLTHHGRFRLEPGQIIQVDAHGAAVGEGDYEEQFSTGQIGKVILAKASDDLRITWDVRVPGFETSDGKGNKKVPSPGDWQGTLTAGEVKFRVVAPDPQAKPGVGVATGPGRYALAPGVRLQVTRITHADGKFTNEAKILWIAENAKDARPTKQHPLKLPDGLSTFAIAWQRGGTTVWIADAASLRRISYADAEKVKEDRWNRADAKNVDGLTTAIREALEKHMLTDRKEK